MVITVEYENDGPMRVVTDPSERCEGDMIATRERLHLDDKAGITWEPRVLSATSGKMRAPRCVLATESVTESRQARPNTIDTSDARSWVKSRSTKFRDAYTLVSADELVGATSITIDGVLAYVTGEDGHLTRLASTGISTDEGIENQFDRLPSESAVGSTVGMVPTAEPEQPER